MAQTQLSTSQIADLIRDHMDDMRVSGDIDDRLYQKRCGSAVRMLEEINQADIEVCGYLNTPSEAIVYVPAGKNMMTLNVLTEYDYARIISLSQQQADIDPISLSEIIEKKTWASLGTLMNGYGAVYSAFPTGKQRPSWRIRLVGKDQFEANDGLFHLENDDRYYDIDIHTLAYIDEASRVLRLRNAFENDVFISLNASVIPAKVDSQDIDGLTTDTEIFDNYSVMTPPYAKDLLVFKIMQRMVPITHKLQGMLAQRVAQAQSAAYDARPIISRTFRAEPNIGFL
jgi:hypothetical protein